MKRLVWSLMLLVVTQTATAGERPNILFIMSDDHAAPAISAYGSRLAKVAPTPHLDRLAREGMRFRNCFCTNSICTPSRAVIMTGLYSHRNGVYKFTALDQRQPTLPKYLKSHGYQTAFVGKWHLHSNPLGFDFWSILPGQGRYHDTQFVEQGDEHSSGRVRRGKRTTYKGHSTDLITDKALNWFKTKRNPKRPFCFMLHYKAPHDTWQFARRYSTYLAETKIPEPPTLFDHGSGRSKAIERSRQYIGSSHGHHTDYISRTKHLKGKARRRAQYQIYMKQYLRCVKGIDDNIGRVLKYLDDSGLAKNTIVVYTADQGFFLGEHGLYDKRFMYEEALRLPLLVRWPGRIKPGSTNDDLVLNLDFAPTLLDAAGRRVPTAMQGRSFLPLLEGKTDVKWRDAFYYRYYVSHFNTPAHFGLRTSRYKLIHFNEIGEWELFDLKADPREMKNLAGSRRHAELLAKLKARLAALQRASGDSAGDRGNKPRTGFPTRSRKGDR